MAFLNNFTLFELQAFYLSIKVGLFCVICGLPIAFLLAFLLEKKEFYGKSILHSLVFMPLVLPPVAIGYLLMISLGINGFIGKLLYEYFDIRIIFTWKAAVFASLVMALPLMVQSIKTSLSMMNKDLYFAAQTLGKRPLYILLTIYFPLCFPGFLSAFLLGFSRSLGEFGATITFAANIPGETQTLPLALYTAIQTPDGGPQAMRLMIISCAFAIGSFLLVETINKKMKKAFLC